MTNLIAISCARWRGVLTSGLPKVLHWSKLLGQFASVQLIVQAVGLCSGILLVRMLSKNDYAYFIIANTMQATMTMLADLGIGSGLSAIGGRVWHDRFRFGQLINTTLHLRRSLLTVSMLIIGPILVWMLLSNHASYGYTGLIAATVLIGLNLQVTSGVLVVIPRFHLQVGRLQKLDLSISLIRLGLLAAAYFLMCLNAATAVIAAVLTFAFQNYVLTRWARQSVDTSAPINEEDRTALWAIIRKQAPNDIYYCFQGQLMVWLISIFGSTKSIADIGALGRLAVIFSIINSTLSGVVLPRFARCQSASVLKVRYVQIVGCFILFGLGLILLAALFPGPLLSILGPKYMYLKSEVVYMVISAIVNAINGILWTCNASKGWIPASWINIPVGLGTQIMLLFIFDISTVRGVLLMNIFSVFGFIIINVWMAVRELRRFPATA